MLAMPWSQTELLQALKAAAEPTRLRLLAILSEGELTVGEITRILDQSQPRVSRHLKLLCEAGLLARFREQHWVFYRVPIKGEGARLARRVLEMLAPDDDRMLLDRQRTEGVKSDRAEAASGVLDNISQIWPTAQVSEDNETRINACILSALEGVEIGDLLDIGTGTGRMLTLLGDRADQAIGIDISSEMLLVARTRLHEAGLNHCMVRHGNMYKQPFANFSFDTVTIDQVLSQADNPGLVLGEAARILRPGGILLVIDFARIAGESGATQLAGISERSIKSSLQQIGLRRTRVNRLDVVPQDVLVLYASRPAVVGTAVA